MDAWQSGFQTKAYVADPQELFGYNEPNGILDQLCATLGSGTNTQVLGERNAGKTSVLRCIATRFSVPQSKHLPVYLEFHGTGIRSPIDAYRHIVARVHATFLARSNTSEELCYGQLRMSANPAVDHYAALQALDEYQMLSGVERYFQQLNARGYGVLLLFDEYEYLMREVLQGQAEKFWGLRNVAQMPPKPDSPRPLTIALAGALEWGDFCGRYGSPPLNIVSAVRVLPPLSLEPFGKMWEHCVQRCGSEACSRLGASGVTIDQVYRLAGGWAFAGKVIGQHVIACGKLDQQQLASDFRPHFRVLWEQRTDAEREQLLAVARGHAVPLDALADLRRRGLVDDTGHGEACLRGELWEEWIKAKLASRPVPPEPEAPTPNLFLREDDCYRVRYEGGTAHTFTATDGFHYLAQLLSHPNPKCGIEALQLETVACKAPLPNTGTEDDEAPTADSYTPQEAADLQTRKNVANELERVMARIAEITDQGFEETTGELKSLENRKQRLSEYLTRARGLGGRQRTLGSSPERKAYDRVRKALNKAYEIIEQQLPDLAEHLRKSIKAESNSFAYRPASPIDWGF